MEKTLDSLPAGFEGLVALVKLLRSDKGCPWDREQTADQIKTYLLEEAYEVLQALESGASEDVCSELGDLLFQIVFLARIFEETGRFNIGDVLRTVALKMVRRHPHVFGRESVSNSDEVRNKWHEIKIAEAREKGLPEDSFLDSVPKNLPALMRAYRIGQRAAQAGVDRADIGSLVRMVDKGLAGLKSSMERGSPDESADAVGDLLFAVVNLSRACGVHPEAALTSSISGFVRRFGRLEKALAKEGRSLESASDEEIRAIWNRCSKADPVSDDEVS